MIYSSYTQTDAYYEFVGSEGKLIMPASDVILVDDESGMLAIKNTASRCTVGLLKIAPPPPSPKWIATYSDSHTESAECGASSAITSGEITKTDLVAVEIGGCVTSIDYRTFRYCYDLTSCTIGTSVTTIGDGAFQDCSSLASINIPDSVTSIGGSAFWGCSSLASCTIGTSVTSIGNSAFRDCTSLTSIDVPSGVTSIGNSAFSGCRSLTSIVILDSVTSIGSSAFYQCSGLTSCTIGSSVTSIGNQAFWGCGSLTSVTVNATTPPTLGSNVFGNTNNCPIYVLAESVDAYKSAWSTYASRIQAIQ